MTKIKDLTGKIYGTLTVISFAGHKKDRPCWNCVCTCGNSKAIRSNALVKAKSCGCYRYDRKCRVKHGDSKGVFEYICWQNMKRRCLDEKNNHYGSYGGRGIIVCDRWLNSYENFLADMGRAPSPKHSLDRKDNDGNYEPDNCRWATGEEQRDGLLRMLLKLL